MQAVTRRGGSGAAAPKRKPRTFAVLRHSRARKCAAGRKTRLGASRCTGKVCGGAFRCYTFSLREISISFSVSIML